MCQRECVHGAQLDRSGAINKEVQGGTRGTRGTRRYKEVQEKQKRCASDAQVMRTQNLLQTAGVGVNIVVPHLVSLDVLKQPAFFGQQLGVLLGACAYVCACV